MNVLVAVLSILLLHATFQIVVYRQEVQTLIGTNDTLFYDNMAQHRIFADCKAGIISHPLTWKWYK